MATALDADETKLNSRDRNFVQQIRQHGRFRTGVMDDETGPGFSCTTGFHHSLRIPEVIVFSLPNDTAHTIFWNIFNAAKAGRDFRGDCQDDDVLETFPVWFRSVRGERYRDFLGFPLWFYGNAAFPCQQLIRPDRSGHFPWQPRYAAEFSRSQANLTSVDW
jgi:hypothetical protein